MVQCEMQEPCLFKTFHKAGFQWTEAASKARVASL